MLGARTGGLSCPLCSGLDCRTAAGPALDFWLGEQAQGTLRHPASAGGRGGWRVVAGETRLGVAGSAVGDSAGTWSFGEGSLDVPEGTPPDWWSPYEPAGQAGHRTLPAPRFRRRSRGIAGDRGRNSSGRGGLGSGRQCRNMVFRRRLRRCAWGDTARIGWSAYAPARQAGHRTLPAPRFRGRPREVAGDRGLACTPVLVGDPASQVPQSGQRRVP
jgi:hypothetical protein